MDKSMIKGIAVGGLAMVVIGASGVTGYKAMTAPKVADVVAVKEVMETVVTPRESCENVQVQKAAPVKDQNRIAGTVVGGLAGYVYGKTLVPTYTSKSTVLIDPQTNETVAAGMIQ